VCRTRPAPQARHQDTLNLAKDIMAYVQEYAPGKYRARKKIDGKLVSKSFTSKSEAWVWAESKEVPRNLDSAPRDATFGPQTLTLGQFVAGGGFATINQRESTQAWTRSMLNANILPKWGRRNLNEISSIEVQQWILELSNSKLAPQTVSHVVKVFKRVMISAQTHGLIEKLPTSGLVLPRIDAEEMRFLEVREVKVLEDSFSDDFRAFVPLCSYAGLRISEAFGLRWDRLNLFKGTVEVAEIVTEVSGHLKIGPPKTRAARRTITIPRSVVAALADHQRRQGGSGDGFVFRSSKGGPVRVRSFRKWKWAPAVRVAGLEPLRPHDLRHTAVAMWIAAGASPKEVAFRAGHTSVSFCLDTYGHLFPSLDTALASRLDDMIAES
jgi:integrase